MERFLRITALAISGATLLWLSGCSSPSADSDEPEEKSAIAQEIERRNAEQAAAQQATAEAAAKAEQERLMNEAPTVVTTDDMKRGKKITGSGPLRTPIRAGIVAEQRLNMIQVTHALNLFWGLEGRYPESHEEFMAKVIKANGIQLEPLEGPYEYWYNPEDHELYKRPIVQGEAARAAAADSAEE